MLYRALHKPRGVGTWAASQNCNNPLAAVRREARGNLGVSSERDGPLRLWGASKGQRARNVAHHVMLIFGRVSFLEVLFLPSLAARP